MKQQAKFGIKFEGKEHSVNASTYATVLAETVVLFQEANKELDPLSPVTLEVNAEKNGSFVSYLNVLGIGEGSLFPKEAFETAVLTISTVV